MKSMFVALGSVLVILSLTGCGDSDAPEQKTAAAAPAATMLNASAVIVAEKKTLHPEFRLPAVIEAIQQAKIIADVPAPLIKNHFTAGDLVKKGQLLVELDPAQYKASRDAANAELLSAKANLEQAQANNEQQSQRRQRHIGLAIGLLAHHQAQCASQHGNNHWHDHQKIRRRDRLDHLRRAQINTMV